MKQLSELGEHYDDTFLDIRAKVKELQREMSAMMLADYPNRDLIVTEAEALQNDMGADEIWINVLLEGKQITIVAQPDGSIVSTFLDEEQSLCVFVVGTDEPLAVDNIKEDPFLEGKEIVEKYGSWASVPLTVVGQTAGAVCALNAEPHAWTDEDQDKLERISSRISRIINEWAESRD